MAYMTQDGRGPYPNKKDEYCGNHHLGHDMIVLSDYRETPEQAQKREEEFHAYFRFGRPRPCVAGTSKEMQAQGFVGLYLKKDDPLEPGRIEVETPEELREPDAFVRRIIDEKYRFINHILNPVPEE